MVIPSQAERTGVVWGGGKVVGGFCLFDYKIYLIPSKALVATTVPPPVPPPPENHVTPKENPFFLPFSFR